VKPRTPESAGIAKSIALTRKLALSQFSGQNVAIGPEFLAAGILKSLPDGGEYLKSCGLAHIATFMSSMPDALESEMDKVPPLQVTDELNLLLNSKLSGFKDGTLSAKDALRILLEIPGITDRLVTLSEDIQNRQNPVIGEREIMARVTRLFQYGYRLALTYYSPDSKIGISEFATEQPTQSFLKAADEYRKERDAVRSMMYSGPRKQKMSAYERYMRTYGPFTADVATAVVVNELTPYVCDGSLITVRDIAYTIAPYDYHRMAGKVIEAVQTLKKDALVRLFPEPDYCQMFSGVLPTEALISDYTQYLGRSADW